MRYATICSGIGAPELAFQPLGWEPVFCSEIEPFPNAVLKHHRPDVHNFGDMTKYKEWPDVGPIDLICAGTPCQAFSVAGLRKGLDDPRGNLTLVFAGILDRFRPRWLVWENVPGVLSDKTGAFGSFLWALGQIGYGFAYRILDAQYFGVAQRRRRVFVVGHLGGWRRAAAVLFERDCLSGNPPPSREKGQGIADNAISRALTGCKTATGRLDPNEQTFLAARTAQTSANGHGIAEGVAHTIDQAQGQAICLPINTMAVQGRPSDKDRMCFGIGQNGDPSPSLSKAHSHAIAFKPGQSAESRSVGAEDEIAPTVEAGGGGNNKSAVCFAQNTRDEVREMEVAGTLAAEPGAKQQSYLRQNMQVRRLTPMECERLQGFPDNFTRIPWKGKSEEQCPDGPRYKALGNSMAVPVVRWIGERINMVDKIKAPGA